MVNQQAIIPDYINTIVVYQTRKILKMTNKYDKQKTHNFIHYF